MFLFLVWQDQLDCNDVDLAALLYQDGITDLNSSCGLIECYKRVVELKRSKGEPYY